MVEAAGIEPDPGQSTNRLMAHDFRSNCPTTRCLLPRIESPGVPSSPLESTPNPKVEGKCPDGQLFSDARTLVSVLYVVKPSL
jgi:hypothetical protein